MGAFLIPGLGGLFPLGFLRNRVAQGGILALGLGGIGAGSAPLAGLDPTLRGALIVLLMIGFGQFVLSRWRHLLIAGPIMLILLSATPGAGPSGATADAAEIPPTVMRPIARPTDLQH